MTTATRIPAEEPALPPAETGGTPTIDEDAFAALSESVDPASLRPRMGHDGATT